MAKRTAKPPKAARADIIQRLLEELVDDQNRFMAGKNKDVPYTIEPPELLGIKRNEEFDAWATESFIGRDPKAQLKFLLEMKKAHNDLDFSKQGYMIENSISAVGRIMERTNATLRICCLFINREGEDRNVEPTEAEARRKMDDWAQAGIPFPFFLSCVKDFSPTLEALYESGSLSSPPLPQLRPDNEA